MFPFWKYSAKRKLSIHYSIDSTSVSITYMSMVVRNPVIPCGLRWDYGITGLRLDYGITVKWD